jgi:hypothetical protein
MFMEQDMTIFPTSIILRRTRREKLAPGEDQETSSACCGVCSVDKACPFDGCRLDSSAFAGGPCGDQLEFDFGTQH